MSIFNIIDNSKSALEARKKHNRNLENIDSYLKNYKALQSTTKKTVDTATENFQEQVQFTLNSLENARLTLSKVKSLSQGMDRDIESEESYKFDGAINSSISESEVDGGDVLKSGLQSSTGLAASLAGYGAVGVLGTASTGTAIGGLSGAAATNATLAWFGGGALTAGGGGMALGTTILGSIVAAPLLFVAADFANNHYTKKLKQSDLEEKRISKEFNEFKVGCELASEISTRIENKVDLLSFISERADSISHTLAQGNDGNKPEWSVLVDALTSNLIELEKATKNVVKYPLLTKDNALAPTLSVYINEISVSSNSRHWNL